MDIYYIPKIMLLCCSYRRSSGCWFHVGSYGPLTCQFCFGFWALPYFHHYKMLRAHLVHFCPSPGISHFSKKTWILSLRKMWETKIWVLGVLFATGLIFISSWKISNIYLSRKFLNLSKPFTPLSAQRSPVLSTFLLLSHMVPRPQDHCIYSPSKLLNLFK